MEEGPPARVRSQADQELGRPIKSPQMGVHHPGAVGLPLAWWRLHPDDGLHECIPNEAAQVLVQASHPSPEYLPDRDGVPLNSQRGGGLEIQHYNKNYTAGHSEATP